MIFAKEAIMLILKSHFRKYKETAHIMQRFKSKQEHVLNKEEILYMIMTITDASQLLHVTSAKKNLMKLTKSIQELYLLFQE